MSAETPHLLKRLWRDYVARHSRILIIALVLMTIEGGMLGALSYMVQPLFDDVFVAKNSAGVWVVSLTVFVLFTSRALAGAVQRYLVVLTGLRVVTHIQKDLTTHLLALDARFFLDNAPGALIERTRGDAQALRNTASQTLITLGRDTISLISLLTVAVWIDWFWALMVFVGAPMVALPILFLQRRIRATSRRAREASATITTRLDEMFHGIPAIKVNTLEAREQGRFNAAIDTYLASERRAQVGLAIMPAMIDMMSAIGFLLVLTVGGQEIVAGEKSVGAFMSFFTAMALIFDPLRRLANVSGQIQAAMASLERLYALFDVKPTILDQPAQPAVLPAKDGDIVFEDVSFGYGDQPVLQGLSFVAKAGETTALVGPSGAGKSTVFNLLARLIDPATGRVLIGDAPIMDMQLAALRRHFALVSQDAALFDETISDNIRLGRLDAAKEAIRKAAENASVTAFSDEMQLGLQTPAGPRGGNLSGGQRQRVAIARAMLRDAPVLLLDEPTSALDARSEALIQTALDRLSQGRTTLVVAHRLSTIQTADQIIVMDEGRVVDSGRHAELMSRGGLYAQLHELQFHG